MLKGIETAVYYVEDLSAATRWYRETFDIAPNHESPYYVGFTVAGYELGLHPVEKGLRKAGSYEPTAYWTVNDIESVMAHLVERGAKVHHAAQDVGGGIQIGSVLDPFGNVFGIIQNPRSPNRR